MSDALAPLIADFLEWVDREPRTYADVMDAWRTSCPRLTVWEDAIDRGLVARLHREGFSMRIELTMQGRAFLSSHRLVAASAVKPASEVREIRQ